MIDRNSFFSVIAISMMLGALTFLSIEIMAGTGVSANKDQFPVTDELISELSSGGNGVLGEFAIPEHLKYQYVYREYPLVPEDYYWGKFTNAAAGVNELNRIPVLKAGDRIEIINDGYLTLYSSNGYVQPTNGFYYASGVCWTFSALGAIMDDTNHEFNERWGTPLFIYNPGDRAGHGAKYGTYAYSNGGEGYAILKLRNGGGQDYKFTVNPEINNIPELRDLEIKLVLESEADHPTASHGESINGYVLFNRDIFGEHNSGRAHARQGSVRLLISSLLY